MKPQKRFRVIYFTTDDNLPRPWRDFDQFEEAWADGAALAEVPTIKESRILDHGQLIASSALFSED